MQLDKLIMAQGATSKTLQTKIRNFKKTSKERQTRGYLENQISSIKSIWDEYYQRHHQIISELVDDADDDLPYFNNNDFEQFEDMYSEILGTMTDVLYTVCPTTNQAPLPQLSAIQPIHNANKNNELKLPRITIPKFSGEYKEWRSFHDLYISVIHSNQGLPKVQKMQYLKSNLQGEAELLIKSLQVTDGNYDSAWKILCDRYENKRMLVDQELKAFFNLSKIQTENAQSIKTLIDSTNESLQALSNLEIDISKWDPILVFMTVQKLPSETHQLWEQALKTDDLPSFKELTEFLVRRFKTLEILSTTNPKSINQRRTQAFVAKTNFKQSPCSLCGLNPHPLKTCSSFINMNVADRHEIIRKKNLCKKCFAYSHTTSSCLSHRKCAICNKDHNTLLHYESSPYTNSAPSGCSTVNSSPSSLLYHSVTPNIQSPYEDPRSQSSAYTTGNGTGINAHIPKEPICSQSSACISSNDPGANCHIPKIPICSQSSACISSIEPGLNLHLPKNSHCSQSCAHISANGTQTQDIVILPTALVTVYSSNGVPHTLRALIDQCSMSTFITEAAIQTLGISKSPVHISVSGIGKSEAPIAKSKVTFRMNSQTTNFYHDVQALVLPSLTHLMPVELINIPKLNGIDFQLADPKYGVPNKIDILLGADVYANILLNGIKRISNNGPLLQNTSLGWIISGNVNNCPNKIISLHSQTTEADQLDKTLKRFWEIEEIHNKLMISKDDLDCETFYQQTHKRLQSGKYEVQLPFKNNPIGSPDKLFGESRATAVSRLFQMERKFLRNPELQQQYIACMDEYVRLGHMIEEPITISTALKTPSQTYNCMYLPHHAVIKESSTTTKLRVVYDASCKSSNFTSLNEKLLTGPPLQDELIILIIKWRKHAVAFNADIEKMYRMVKVADVHTPYQKIVWRDNPNQPVKDYRLLTLTFGTASAPYLAIRTLQQLANDEQHNYPLGAKAILNDFYVDDLLSGADSIENAQALQKQIICLLSSGGFSIRKWSSNTPELLTHISPENREIELPLSANLNNTIKKLGLHWHPKTDQFKFSIQEEEDNTNINSTKRNVLSNIAKLFDPLGWLAPSIIIPKMLMQDIWLSGTNWDEDLPHVMKEKWLAFKNTLKYLGDIQIPRWVHTNQTIKSLEMHGFCDASEKAYAAVVYIKVVTYTGESKIELIIAKTRVAPIKQISLPRLELCGALLLSKLMTKIRPIFETKSIWAWTDSMIVLAWLRSHPNKWKSFVANRVSEIQELLQPNLWNHVRSHDNPADCATRGVSPTEMATHPLWWHGPEWLKKQQHLWPTTDRDISTTDLELKKFTNAFVSLQVNPITDSILQRCSSFKKIVMIIAFCYKFISKTKGTQGFFSEIKKAKLYWYKYAQQSAFFDDITRLDKVQSISPKSNLLNLNPFLDSDGIMRVGGRLKNSHVPEEFKHSIILSNKGRFTELIIHEAHLETQHGGTQLVMAHLRNQYWILNCRNTVRHIINKCLRCHRFRAHGQHQLMGNLPTPRVNFTRTFDHTGIDYCGPFEILEARGRGKRKFLKGYIALFVCMSIKAIHLEVVSDMTTQAFLAALRRFIGRRGLPSNIYTDNGTNFVGADNVLKAFIKSAEKQLSEIESIKGIKWNFIPPSSPHFGGLWEAGVSSTKHHLKRIVGTHRLTYEEMNTTLIQIEACLNSRPLCPMTNDPQDLMPLTPGHFLVGGPLLAHPEPSFLDSNINRLDRWQLIQRLQQQFCKRWQSEYLSRLQQRPKWMSKERSIQMHDLVLVMDERLPPMKWSLGRVIKVGGEDGLTRTVTVRTQNSEYKKPITKLALLPIADNIIPK